MQSNGELIASYPKLFDTESREVEEATLETKEKKVESFSEHWGWLCVWDSLSNNDITKWGFINDMNVIDLLNILAYYKDKQKHQQEQIDLA